ncbi:hypothetical protein T492DRAFT_546902 [Pavlovales sp. CCMP2436]|nr:hypothetical protein T492DRAFT_546902 [Pavlovales sp. CCMP2436]
MRRAASWAWLRALALSALCASAGGHAASVGLRALPLMGAPFASQQGLRRPPPRAAAPTWMAGGSRPDGRLPGAAADGGWGPQPGEAMWPPGASPDPWCAADVDPARAAADAEAARDYAAGTGDYAGYGMGSEANAPTRWWRMFEGPAEGEGDAAYNWRDWKEPEVVRKRVRMQQTVATIRRVILPSIVCTVLGVLYFDNITAFVMRSLDAGGLVMVMQDESQFIQNFLTVIGLLFSILAGNAYSSLYTQQESIYFALFHEVSEAKSLLEQTTLVCQGRPFYPAVLAQFELYVSQVLFFFFTKLYYYNTNLFEVLDLLQ